MPIHFGHPNNKGLTVSPSLKSLGIDLLRAAPSDIRILANPRIIQDGYSSYVSHIAAFMSAYVKQQTVPTNQVGYPVSLPMNECIPLQLPNLVVSYNGQIPSSAIESLNNIGFERIKANKKEDLLIFRNYTLDEARAIARTNPIKISSAPGGAVNLAAFDSYIIVVKVISNFLRAHTYPAFIDEEHGTDLESQIESYTSEKRGAKGEHTEAPPTKKAQVVASAGSMEIDEEVDIPLPPTPKKEIKLHRAKPPSSNAIAWGTPSQIPNASGIFFPFIPELCSWDHLTVPNLIEDYFLKSLGKTPEQQVDRSDSIRSAWGVVSKTDAGNVLAHLGKVIHLAIRSQCRVFPLVSEGVYHGCILSGARFYIGHYGKIIYPTTYAKLQDETGSFHFHTKVLTTILDLVGDDDANSKGRPTTMRELRKILLDATLSEEERDEIRKLAVHLNFKEKFMGLNAQTIIKLLDELNNLADQNDELPLHPSALFSRDAVYVALSAFGYQAPSPMIDSCPKIKVKGGSPPNTFVFRQKPLDIATIDWKKVLETREITNNPRNLSRQNRDRAIVGNDKATVWGKMVETMSAGGVALTEITAADVVEEDEDDNVGAW
jgi:hypothetical protein